MCQVKSGGPTQNDITCDVACPVRGTRGIGPAGQRSIGEEFDFGDLHAVGRGEVQRLNHDLGGRKR